MKILLYSDLHLYNHHKQMINAETALSVLTKAEEYCLENDIKHLIFGGDFFHTKAKAYAPHVIQAWLRIKSIQKNGIEHYMLIGNHDMATPTTTMNSIMFIFNDYAKVIPDYHFIDFNDTRIHFLSYTNEVFEDFILAEEKKNILIAHLDIISFQMTNGYQATNGFSINDFKDFDLVFSGHYHKHQTKENITYIGSPYQTAFSERDQPHGFVLLDTDTLEWELIELSDAPKYKVFEISSINDLEKINPENKFIRIKVGNRDLLNTETKEILLNKGALTVDIVPPEDAKEIEQYYDSDISEVPFELAASYLNSLTNIEYEEEKLLKYFEKLEDFANKITDYEV